VAVGAFDGARLALAKVVGVKFNAPVAVIAGGFKIHRQRKNRECFRKTEGDSANERRSPS
jgi:hypothetical protein